MTKAVQRREHLTGGMLLASEGESSPMVAKSVDMGQGGWQVSWLAGRWAGMGLEKQP